MKGQDVRCAICGATALRSVAPDFELENHGPQSHSYFFLTCDGVPRHEFTFSADEQWAMSKEEGATRQNAAARFPDGLDQDGPGHVYEWKGNL